MLNRNLVKLVVSVCVATIASSGPSAAAEPTKPAVSFWHLWVDGHGTSHLAQCQLEGFTLSDAHKPAPPQWQDKEPGAASVTFEAQPGDYEGAWHEDPHVQWVVPLQGKWFVEAQDGKRVELGPGSVFLGEDQNTVADAQGHKGHLSGGVGGVPVSLMLVALDLQPTVDRPCHLK